MGKMIWAVFLSLVLLPFLARAQSAFKIFPIAADSTINETEPYLTRYLYEAAFRFEDGNTEKTLPLWLVYKKTTREGNAGIVGIRIQVRRVLHQPPQIKFSKKYLISDLVENQTIESPLIEYYADYPVAIWRQKKAGIFSLFYSVFRDSVWSSPQKVTSDSLNVSEEAFFATHSREESSEYARFNRLFWISGKSIYSAEMDSTFHWVHRKKLYTGSSEIAHLYPRMDFQENLWLAFDELFSPDSLKIQVIYYSRLKQKWEGPVELARIRGRRSFAGLNISEAVDPAASASNTLALAWLDGTTFKSRIFSFDKDSLVFHSNFDFEHSFACSKCILTSNNLDLGGCVLTLVPWYFLVCQSDSVPDQLYMIGYNNYFFKVFSRKNSIQHISISGTQDFNFALALEEWDGNQSDIYLNFQTIIIGAVNENPTSSPRSMWLSQNWPNPFNAVTNVEYILPIREKVTLRLFNSLGEEVKLLCRGIQGAGRHVVQIDGQNLS
ncbi:MAG: hypothetical protein GXO76_11965, partial [Calditrichaeota bacterium]|nr:hypothetical protein [Calditrichota bacterium]